MLLAVASGCETTTSESAHKLPSAGEHEATNAAANEPTRGITTVGDTVIATAIDPDRGLKFQVESSTVYGDTGLHVTALDDAPIETRELVRVRPLVATCDIPDRHVGEFAGYWNDRFDQFGTALMFDPTPRPAARLVTSCRLWIGSPDADADTATFPDDAFSTVRFG